MNLSHNVGLPPEFLALDIILNRLNFGDKSSFLATACEANRGLSHRFAVIYLFICLVSKLFSKIATPPKIVDGFECGFFYINL